MNAIQMIEQVAFLSDRVGSARFNDDQYIKAINSAIIMILEDRLDNIKKVKRYSFEAVQRVRDELYTLVVPTVTITPTGNTLAYPADYNYFLKLECLISGVTSTARATSYNESGFLGKNPFKKPSATKPYFDQNKDGFVIYRGTTGTFTSAALDYIKNPDSVSIGNETDKISAGANVLVAASVYIVYEEAVHNGVTYLPGATFTAANTALTSGIVILNSVITSCNLPVKIHQEVARLASAVMNGTIDAYQKKQDLKADNQDS